MTPDFLALAARLKDADGLEAVGEAVGVKLDAAALEALTKIAELRGDAAVGFPKVLSLIHDAVRAEAGIHYDRSRLRDGWGHLLLVRFDDGARTMLAFDADRARTQGIASSWPELKPWKKKLEENAGRCDAWARACPLKLETRAVEARVVPARAASTEKGLMQAVVDAPDDDVPRLVYADFLEEQGDPRAQVIRLQCELAKLPRDTEPWRALQRQIHPLLDVGWKKWAGPAAAYAEAERFERGFVDRVSMTVAAFLKHGEALFREQPIRMLLLKTKKFTEKDLVRLGESPAMRWVRKLAIMQADPHSDRLPVAALATGQNFDRLESLSLDFCGFSADDWESMFRRLNAPKLRTVRFHYNHGSSGIYLGLARNPVLKHFEAMDEYVYRSLDGDHANDKLATAMAELARARPSFKTWDRSGTEIASDAAVQPFFDEANRATLTTLALTNCHEVTDATAQRIAGSPKAKALTKLHFFNSSIGLRGLKALVASEHLTALKDFGFTTYDKEVFTAAEWTEACQLLVDLPEARAPKHLELRGSYVLAPPLAEALKKRYGNM